MTNLYQGKPAELDTSVHEVNTDRNIMQSLKEYNQKIKQPFFDGSALPYAKASGVKAGVKDI